MTGLPLPPGHIPGPAMRAVLLDVQAGRITRHYDGVTHEDRYPDGTPVTATSLGRASACGFIARGDLDGGARPLLLTEAGADALTREGGGRSWLSASS